MKSVCLVVQNFYDFDIRVRRKAEALAAAGYSVDVLALGDANHPKRYSLGGVHVKTLWLGKKRGSPMRYAFEYVAFFLWAMWCVTAQMCRKRYAVIDFNTLPDFLVFAGVFARLKGAKLILDMHEITPEFYMSKYGIAEGRLAVSLLKWVERISFNFADHVITINEPIRNLLVNRGLHPQHSTIIMNSADEAHFVHRRHYATTNAPDDSAPFVFMYHGTLTRIYGLDIAIAAFAIATSDMPGAELWILGGGTEAQSLGRQLDSLHLNSNVKLVGLIAPGEIPDWLDKCDVGVLPIRRDVFLDFASPNKLAEYIITDKPVIISRLRAVKYYFSEDALAYFEPGSPADLAAQMIRLYRDAKLRRRLAARAKEEYAPIRWDVMRERYLTLVETVRGIGHGGELQQTVPAASSHA